jgi:hypothetical protein
MARSVKDVHAHAGFGDDDVSDILRNPGTVISSSWAKEKGSITMSMRVSRSPEQLRQFSACGSWKTLRRICTAFL